MDTDRAFSLMIISSNPNPIIGVMIQYGTVGEVRAKRAFSSCWTGIRNGSKVFFDLTTVLLVEDLKCQDSATQSAIQNEKRSFVQSITRTCIAHGRSWMGKEKDILELQPARNRRTKTSCRCCLVRRFSTANRFFIRITLNRELCRGRRYTLRSAHAVSIGEKLKPIWSSNIVSRVWHTNLQVISSYFQLFELHPWAPLLLHQIQQQRKEVLWQHLLIYVPTAWGMGQNQE